MEGKDGTAILGLKGKVFQLHQEMQILRAKYGLDVTLRSHLAQNYGGLTPEQLYTELQINPQVMTVQNLMTTDEDTKWLFPEIIRDAIRKGVVAEPVYPALIASTDNVASPNQVMPYFDLSDAKPTLTNQGATIQKGSVTWGSKTVKLSTFARGIDIAYEAIQYCPLSLLATFMIGFGLRLGALISRAAVECLINGDQDDGSEAAEVIGVEAATPGIEYVDIARACVRMGLMGHTPDNIVGSEDTALAVLQLDEFKKRYTGTPDMALRLQTPLPTEQNLFAQVAVSDGCLIEVCKAVTMAYLVSQALLVESDKIIARRIQESVASITAGFGIIDRTGRLIIDTNQTFAGQGFSTWFAPVE